METSIQLKNKPKKLDCPDVLYTTLIGPLILTSLKNQKPSKLLVQIRRFMHHCIKSLFKEKYHDGIFYFRKHKKGPKAYFHSRNMSNLLLQNTFSPWTIKVGCGQLRNSEIIALSVNKKGEFFLYELVFIPRRIPFKVTLLVTVDLPGEFFVFIFFLFRLERKTENTWTIRKPYVVYE